jgi:hypothetical protein
MSTLKSVDLVDAAHGAYTATVHNEDDMAITLRITTEDAVKAMRERWIGQQVVFKEVHNDIFVMELSW